jgi:hypothetical protein
MINSYCIEGLPVQTGDIICTCCGGETIRVGDFWRLLGRLTPGTVDHVAIYVGPGGRCVEAGPFGVIDFTLTGESWNAGEMTKQRGHLVDRLYGVAYPLLGRDLPPGREAKIRTDVGHYCLAQAKARKPYNLNFLNPDWENSFYCSQLAYKAYLPHGINLNTGLGILGLAGTDSIVFPQEIWTGCRHRQAGLDQEA